MADIQVFNMDNEDISKYPDNHFTLACVDPQYGINAPKMNMGSSPNRNEKGQYPGISTNVKLKGRLNTGSGKLKNRILNKSEIDWDNELPSAEYWKQLFRVSQNQMIFGGNYFGLPASRGIVCWDKLQPWENFSQWEMIWTSFDFPAKMFRFSNRGGNNKKTKINPTEKPIELYLFLYKLSGLKPGDRILDTHLGSGNSRIAAYLMDIDFIGYEKRKSQFDDSIVEFEKVQGITRIKDSVTIEQLNLFKPCQ